MPAHSDNLDQQARRRAGAKLGWYLHACAYVLVNTSITLLAAYNGQHWAIFPAIGWGLGLLMHGAIIWTVLHPSGWYARLVERERATLQRSQSQDPW